MLSYDSNMDDLRDNKKNKFANTMVFMEEYLNNVLNDDLPFADEEKNKLTYEVSIPSSFLFPFNNTVNTSKTPIFGNGTRTLWLSTTLE